jgi:hypothetical protein
MKKLPTTIGSHCGRTVEMEDELFDLKRKCETAYYNRQFIKT